MPAATVLDATGVASHALYRERALFERVAQQVLDSNPVNRLTWHIGGEPVPITRRAPLLGEHNDYTLQSVLGLSPDRVKALRDTGLFA